MATKERTFQKTSQLRPQRQLKHLGLMVGCGNCPAFRVFKIDTVLELIKNRDAAGHLIETECEECGNMIAVAIGWIDATEPGYSYRKMEFPVQEYVTVVSDESGLKGE